MTKTALKQALKQVNHSKESRNNSALFVQKNKHLLPVLMEIAFSPTDPLCSRACWVLEYAVRDNPSFLFPYMEYFAENLGVHKADTCIRPMAKICELVMTDYFENRRSPFNQNISIDHLEKICTACFDWLIGDFAVAAKAYSMTSLYFLGKKINWIHPELRLVIEQNYAVESAAYKARARHILAKIRP